MTISSSIYTSHGTLYVNGKPLLTSVPSNISLSTAQGLGLVHGAFLGATTPESKHHHVFSLGVLEGHRFLCCFRFKLWWMTQRMGACGKDVPSETQFLLVEVKDSASQADTESDDEQTTYVVFLPLLEDAFRATLKGNDQNELELCLESGDVTVQTNGGRYSMYLNSGTNPFEVITDAVRAVEEHLQTFRHRKEKKMPSFLDWFGWCTWDAFYNDVTTEGIREGLDSLTAGGAPPRFLIIDDGWQSVATDQQPETASVTTGSTFASRLTHIKENYKFQKDGKDGERHEDPALGLRMIVHEAKEQHNVKYVYVWHALTGYWGGVKPGIPGMEHYESALKYPVQSPGITANESDYAFDIIAEHGLGLVHPNKVFQFYDELHSYLAAAGVDGVKVDVQNILETLGSGFGGRVSLTRKYHQALEASIAHNFPDNGCISCMSHNTDGIYSSKQTAVARASDDFYPRDPASHTIHIASVAYNSLFLGEFMQPDWDMFHSLHPAAEYHAAARAVGGCAIYVSDKPGNHNFDLLKKLVLPDGSILRAELPGRPSRDCLFNDPARDGKSLLKIWNMNKCTGVLGVFNCQGAGWCRVVKKNLIHDGESKAITSSVRSRDVDRLPQIASEDWNGDTIVYSHKLGELVYLPEGSSLHLTLKPKEYEVLTVVPVKVFRPGVSFAPVGAMQMFNAGGAVKSVDYQVVPEEGGKGITAIAEMRVIGCGVFGVYSSVRPTRVVVGFEGVDFTYEEEKGLVTTLLPLPKPHQHGSWKGEDGNGERRVWPVRVELQLD